MKKTQKQQSQHKFAELPGFDEAMRKLAQVPKEDVEKREAATRTPRVTDERLALKKTGHANGE